MLLTRLTLALALLAPVACQAFMPSGPSAVAQGRYFSSGEPDYDAFFLQIYRLQVKLKDAPPRVGEPRQRLAEALEVGPDPEEIRTALARRAKELGARGIRYTVARPTSAEAPPTLVVTGNPTGKDFELKGLLEAALKSTGELKVDTVRWQKELDDLGPRGVGLEGTVEEAFAGRSEGQRTDVRNNLSDAQKIITLLVERTRDLDHASSDLLKAFTSALGETNVETSSSEASDATEEDEPDEKGAKPAAAKAPKAQKAPPPKPPAKASGAAPKPKPTPAPKATPPKPASKAPKASDSDDAPPPKPTQGTAKPDFEP